MVCIDWCVTIYIYQSYLNYLRGCFALIGILKLYAVYIHYTLPAPGRSGVVLNCPNQLEQNIGTTTTHHQHIILENFSEIPHSEIELAIRARESNNTNFQVFKFKFHMVSLKIKGTSAKGLFTFPTIRDFGSKSPFFGKLSNFSIVSSN